MAFNDTTKRVHFINVMKSTKDFSGEHLAPLSEQDVIMLLNNKEIIERINKKLDGSGFSIQINWSEDNGSTWVQYPKSH